MLPTVARHERLRAVEDFFAELPRPICNQLRRVLEAKTPSDEFTCYCECLESLVIHLCNLCNSIYLDRSPAEVDEELEAKIRATPRDMSFGHRIQGLRAFQRIHSDLKQKMPPLAMVLREKALPAPCAQMEKSFNQIKKARERFEIPSHRLEEYLEENLSPNLGKVNIEQFLNVVVTFRNRGVGHRTDDSWFLVEQSFYALLNTILEPAIGALLSWQPMREVLTSYEIVTVELGESGKLGDYVLSRLDVLDGFLPLIPSRLQLSKPDSFVGEYVAKRTADRTVLEPVVKCHRFPSTLQDLEQLYQRYRRDYLLAYLDKGAITPSQRQDELGPLADKLAIPEEKAYELEEELKTLVDDYSNSEEEGTRSKTLQEMRRLLVDEWSGIEERIETLIVQLPSRRKDYIYQIIENNTVASFAQLKEESELSEADLEAVLDELKEQDKKIRRIGPHSEYSERSQLFKVQDLQKLDSFKTLLEQLKQESLSSSKKHPESIWRLLQLCRSMLLDDGYHVSPRELDAYRDYFEEAADHRPEQSTDMETDAALMALKVNQKEVHASTVPELLHAVWDEIQTQEVSIDRHIPFLIGRTRYLVSWTPQHANGMSFVVPIPVDNVFFEGNLTRAQALNETIRWLTEAGAEAQSPNIEVEYEHDTDRGVSTTVELNQAKIGIEIINSDGQPIQIVDTTVRRFYTKLLEHLLDSQLDLSKVVPFYAGRVRYLLAEEPYHDNGRRFQSVASRKGYFMEASYPHDQAVELAVELCSKLGIGAKPIGGTGTSKKSEDREPLEVHVAGRKITGTDVPEFFAELLKALYEGRMLTEQDIPYKSGPIRYLLAASPKHHSGRDFIRPIPITLGDHLYYIEANISRHGALEQAKKLLRAKQVA